MKNRNGHLIRCQAKFEQAGDRTRRSPSGKRLALAVGVGRVPQDVLCTTSRTILPKGGVPPPVGYPLHGADAASSLSAPLQRVAVASPVRGAFLLPRHPHDQRSFSRSLGTHRAGGDFRAPPCIPHRSIRRGLKMQRSGPCGQASMDRAIRQASS